MVIYINMFKRFLSYLNKRIFYIWLLFFSFLTVTMSPENGTHYGFVATFILFCIVYFFSEKIFLYLIVFIVFSLSLYYPISLYYGSLNSGIVAAVFETNVAESLEFIGKFKISDFTFPFLYVLSAIILMRLKKYNKRNEENDDDRKKQKILHIILTAVVLFCMVWVPTKHYMEFHSNDDDIDGRWTLANSPMNLISFYANIYNSIDDYFVEKEDLNSAKNTMPDWIIESVAPKYKNYVLIIGESARRDYLSVDGFTLKTSPFIDLTKGYITLGYVATAPATYHSLLNTLYLKMKNKETGKKDYSYNIITLAKSAKFKTFWLSNQGIIGKFDTIASRLGVIADFTYFTKKGGYNTDNVDDMKLLDVLKDKMNEESKNKNSQSRLYVLHLMGSHQKFCHRLNKDENKYEFVNKNLSCYVNTILKTDHLLEKVINLLKEQNESYSLIYFSDHGLSHTSKEDKDEVNLDHGSEFKQNYEIPFVKLSSDDVERKVVNTKRTAFNFMYGFSQWLGIKSKNLNKDYDFFSDKDDENIKVFNFEKYIPFDELKDDEIPKY